MSEQTISEEARKIAEKEAYGAENDEPYGHFVQQALSARDQENARLKEELSGIALVYETNRDELLERIHQLESVIESPEGEIKRLNARISELEKVSDLKSAALVDANQKAIQLNSRITGLERELAGVKARVSKRRAHLIDEVVSVLAKLETSERSTQSAYRQVETLERVGDELAAKLTDLERELETWRKRYDALDERENKLSAEHFAALAKNAELRADLEAKTAMTDEYFEVLCNICTESADTQAKLTASEARCEKLLGAVQFYAAPETYFAVGFIADKPCGDFMDDFDETVFGVKPGKLARNTLKPSTEK